MFGRCPLSEESEFKLPHCLQSAGNSKSSIYMQAVVHHVSEQGKQADLARNAWQEEILKSGLKNVVC